MMDLDTFMQGLVWRNPHQLEFHQAVHEFAEKIIPFVNQNPKYEKYSILERMTEPDRVIIFRVCWQDDEGHVRVNRGYRVQFNNSIGPYKGGIRLDKSVTLSILKFLGFEQVFKNSLTTLPMGGAKGGSDFNPKGKSDGEVMRFCQSFMTELFRYIGKDTDVPAGDIGTGAREVSYLFGQYKRLANEFTGTLTGKGLSFGGSQIRTEATGYGCVYFAREMLKKSGRELAGMRCVVSGSGNVALYAAQKLVELDAKVISLSDRGGCLYAAQGLTQDQVSELIDWKTNQRKSLEDYAKANKMEFFADRTPWHIECDAAFPCATQNEINADDAATLLKNGCILVSEGANMPTEIEGAHKFEAAKILYAPSKAANAGGVAISGLEMTQNSMRLSWSREEVDSRLQKIMESIHTQCVQYGKDGDSINYVKGANVAGFVKVAEAMIAYGVV